MTAESIARALDGRRAGGGWIAHCPAHEDRTPSLSIQDGANGRVLVHCHAGCEQTMVIAALRACALWPEGSRPHQTDVASAGDRTRSENRDTEAALRIWQAAVPAGGTLVEAYLQARGISICVPSTLRFHPCLKHLSGSTWPAMVGLVECGTELLSIHRTFLSRDGKDKARVKPQKMMLGPCRGGAVRLGPIGDRLMIAEGIETALSAMQATAQTAWAALSVSGLRALELPIDVRDVVVLADGDDAGEGAARDAALRWKREDRRVRIARPPRGLDFNDVILGRSLLQAEEAA